MQVSPTYAKRKDLSALLKWKFTVEELISHNLRVRAVYRWYFFSPVWVKGTFDALFFMIIIVPILLAGLCDELSKKMLGRDYDGPAGLIFYAVASVACAWVHPVGLMFLVLNILTVILLWFFLAVMDDYAMELHREADRKKYASLGKKFT